MIGNDDCHREEGVKADNTENVLTESKTKHVNSLNVLLYSPTPLVYSGVNLHTMN